MSMRVPFYIFVVFLGCCSNVFFLEMLTTAHPGSGNIITLAQFVFITTKGFILEHKFGRKKSIIPIKNYMTLVVMFFIVSLLNNYALNFNISMPLHMIFRSGSLIANMILGILLLNKRYSLREYISVVLISIGIFVSTMASSNDMKKKATSVNTSVDLEQSDQEYVFYLWWLVGISMLTVGLLISAGMGLVQEKLYREHGKHPDEALYYIHMLTLPGFLFLSKDIYNQYVLFNQSEPVSLIWFSMPIIWLYLIFNTLTNYVCISSVFVLTTECTSLTVTFVLTLRKFTSLIISIIYFQNPFTVWHWLGTVCVFTGSLMFSNILKSIQERFKSTATKKIE